MAEQLLSQNDFRNRLVEAKHVPGLVPEGVPEGLTERECDIMTISRDSLVGHVDYTHNGTGR
ncbi:MAG: hypothetical protein U0X20_28850 [Caldilineaceae bacterium]